MTPAETDLKNYLDVLTQMRKSMHVPDDFVYAGKEDLLLKHGRFFTPAKLQSRIKPMTPKHCFDNAYRLAQRHRKTLRYVEGMAQHIIPVHHAWCIDKHNVVVDPTWVDDDKYERAYFGVIVPLDRVRTARTKHNCSVLDDWPNGFKILREPFQGEMTQ